MVSTLELPIRRSPKLGYDLGGPKIRDYNILGSILRSPKHKSVLARLAELVPASM